MKLFYKILLFSVVFIWIITNTKAQNTSFKPSNITLQADSLLENNKIVSALDLYKKSLTNYINNKDSIGQFNTYIKMGFLYERISNYNKSVENYYEAYKIAKEQKNKLNLADAYNRLGNLYILDKEYNKAYDYFTKSANIQKELGNQKGIAATYNNIGEVYRYKGEYDKAIEYYQKAIPINTKMDNKQWLAINYENIGTIHHKKGDLKQAYDYYLKALDYAKQINDKIGITSISNNIGRLYYDRYELKKALEYLNIAYNEAFNISSPEYIKDAAKNLSDVYYTMGDYKKAYAYFQIYIRNYDKIKQASESRKISQLETDHRLDKKDKEIQILEQKNENSKLQMYVLILIVVLIIITVLLMYNRIKIKHKKTEELHIVNEQRIEAEKALAETEIKNIELEKEKLQDDLKYKNKELMNFALHIIHKNDFLVNLKDELKLVKSKDINTSKQIREILIKINQSQRLTEELDKFQENVENANKEFFEKLNKSYPDLTPNEKRLAALLRINLSSKEIASLNNISIKAVEMGRYRLRKKLDLATNDGLNDFFRNL